MSNEEPTRHVGPTPPNESRTHEHTTAEGDDDSLIRRAEALAAGLDPNQAVATGGALTPEALTGWHTQVEIGSRIGKFEVTDTLGEGGMGQVFAARDTELDRAVALKRLGTAGLGTPSSPAMRRFRREAKTLSRLDHPNICRLYDLTEIDGVPWLVLERIEGQTLSVWREEAGPNVAEKIELAEQLADAVNAAHRAAIVHRDLKPSNVMVTEDGQAKVLDFGIATATQESFENGALDGVADRPVSDSTPIDHHTALTAAGSVIGTPAYMSPEQLAGDPVGTPTDIYSLALVLAELLSGHRTEEPSPQRASRPSTDSLRGTPAPIRSLLAEMLQAEPSARPSAEQVRARLQRIRTATARRLRRGLIAAAALAVVAFAVKYTLDVQTARDRALAAQAETEEVASFLVSMFEQANPSFSHGQTVTAEDLLAEGARRVDTEMAGRPLLAARFHDVIGEAYRVAGRLDRAATHSSAALALRTEHQPDEPQLAYSLLRRGAVQFDLGEWNEALDLTERAWSQVQGHPEFERLAFDALELRGMTLRRLDRLDEAEEALLRAQALAERLDDPEEVASILSARGLLEWERERPESAIELLQEAVDLADGTMDTETGELATMLNNLGLAQLAAERHEESLVTFERAVDLDVRIYGPDSLRTATTRDNLAGTLIQLGRLEDAVPLVRESLKAFESALPADHPDLAITQGNYAVILFRTDRNEEALDYANRALLTMTQEYGERGRPTAYYHRLLGYILRDLGREADALRRFDVTFAIWDDDPYAPISNVTDTVETVIEILGSGSDKAGERAEACARGIAILQRREVTPEQIAEDLPNCDEALDS